MRSTSGVHICRTRRGWCRGSSPQSLGGAVSTRHIGGAAAPPQTDIRHGHWADQPLVTGVISKPGQEGQEKALQSRAAISGKGDLHMQSPWGGGQINILKATGRGFVQLPPQEQEGVRGDPTGRSGWRASAFLPGPAEKARGGGLGPGDRPGEGGGGPSQGAGLEDGQTRLSPRKRESGGAAGCTELWCAGAFLNWPPGRRTARSSGLR